MPRVVLNILFVVKSQHIEFLVLELTKYSQFPGHLNSSSVTEFGWYGKATLCLLEMTYFAAFMYNTYTLCANHFKM